MSASDAKLNAMVDTMVTGADYQSQHNADPGNTGANEIAGTTRQPVTWATASGGTRDGGDIPITVPAGETCTYVAYWDAATGGTFQFAKQLSAPVGEGTATIHVSESISVPT